MKLFNSRPSDAGTLLEATSNSYAKAVGFAQKGNPHRATKIMNKALSQINNSGYVQIENSRIIGDSGIGRGCDFTTNTQLSLDSLQHPLAILYQSELLYYTDWQAQKIVDLPVVDMLKKSYYFKGVSDEENKTLDIYQENLDIYSVLRQALKMERLYGGSVIFMGLRSDVDDPSLPVDISTIGPDDLLFLNALSRTDISGNILQTDPTLPFYGKPQFFHINGHKVHRSRLLIFDGEPLRYIQRSPFGVTYYRYNDHFGYPILGRILDDLKRATGSRQAAMHLIQRASVVLFAGDIQTASAFKDANQNVEALKTLVNNMSNYRAALINSVPGSEASLSTVAANFGSVPELIMTFLQVLSAAVDIPASRFLSQAPGGLNATGESDAANYRDMLEAKQEHHLKPVLRQLLSIMAPSAGINTPSDDIEIVFPPLETASDRELAEIRAIDTQNVVSMVASNVVSYEEGIEELVQKEVLSTAPADFPDPEPPIFDNEDLKTPGVGGQIDKTDGEVGDDSRLAQ